MEHTEIVTRYIANFVDELVASGLTEVVISPGSRSTPLAMTIMEHPKMNQWIVLDERSAAFFALGMAKKKQRPVAIVCTSGTAAANYFPAVVEAHYSRVPLVVLTADRPHELRDVGAPQAIEQVKLYGDYVKWFNEMALPEATQTMLAYVRGKASRAVHLAMEGNSGPVHLNFPLREPLIPDFTIEDLWGEQASTHYYPTLDGAKRLHREQVATVYKKLMRKEKGIIVCGPQDRGDVPAAITKLAQVLQVPVLADPLSGMRSGAHDKVHVIEGYDAFLRSEQIRKQLKPDYIIRFGAMPVSKPYLFYVKEHRDVEQWIVEEHTGYREPAGNKTEFIYADPALLCDDLTQIASEKAHDTSWFTQWEQMNQITRNHLDVAALPEEQALTEGEAVRCLFTALPEASTVYVGNSMAIRDVDTFFLTTEKNLHVLGNRGANGIDGMVSSGLGAATDGSPTTLLLGDLSFFHDMNGLLAAKQYKLNMTILLINNNGGGIFSYLPQADHQDHFEALFGTPSNLSFHHAIEMYGGHYELAVNQTQLRKALDKSYKEQGLSVIEVQTDREYNKQWHRQKWQAIEAEIVNNKE
ncbi:2-succinyl-5-enolpyruvyl-6-hydroxy-3-cyclohexene-1-carboxylic-acid synthase [Lentibacillus sp. N15]|uniref:2-succinyl-5-enolpyruvyl-6-hydroxy-3- cyclohexene-1-carboxylic-acid synthase n=1 Tax=Lentibacillus songyuanensis TaxID=3136161 RepID=UPI0031BA2590